MKQTIISLLVLAALVGCSKSENEDIHPAGNVPITLNAGMPTAAIKSGSRAVIETGNKFTAGVAGWETDGTVDYLLSENWYTTAEITADPTEQPVNLKEPQVYNANDDIKTYMKAWHPAGKPSNGMVTFDNTDGTVDALFAKAAVGSKQDNTGKILQFKHKTTQLKFKVVADASLDTETTVKGITVLDVELPTGFDLANDALTHAAKGNLNVPGISGNEVITGTAAAVGAPVMIKPLSGNTVKLKIQTSAATFDEVVATIDGDTDFVEGKAYTITLTFKQQAVDLTATVDEWISGSGSAEVE